MSDPRLMGGLSFELLHVAHEILAKVGGVFQ